MNNSDKLRRMRAFNRAKNMKVGEVKTLEPFDIEIMQTYIGEIYQDTNI